MARLAVVLVLVLVRESARFEFSREGTMHGASGVRGTWWTGGYHAWLHLGDSR